MKPHLVAFAAISLLGASANAALISQFGVLDLTANGGINPNTGVAWANGDQYRLAFVSSGKHDAASADPAIYNTWATAQANLSTLGDGSIQTSTGWTAMMSTTTTNARVNTGTNDLTGGAGIGGAGVPVYAMNGTTAIARNNADIWDTWSNPFQATNPTLRAGTAVYYSPFLDQFGVQPATPDANHGVDVFTGSNSNGTPLATQEVGSIAGVNGSVGNTNTGSSNANNTTRIWNRGNIPNIANTRSFYIISPLLTVTDVPEPSTALLGALGMLALLRRRRN